MRGALDSPRKFSQGHRLSANLRQGENNIISPSRPIFAVRGGKLLRTPLWCSERYPLIVAK